jgi:hypothetical protein
VDQGRLDTTSWSLIGLAEPQLAGETCVGYVDTLGTQLVGKPLVLLLAVQQTDSGGDAAIVPIEVTRSPGMMAGE